MNRSRLALLVGCLILLISKHSVAQQVTVIDEDTGDPVENVALFNQDRTISTLTDAFGKADIQEFRNSDSIFLQHPSFEPLGYTRHELAYGPGTIYLARRTILIEEFTVSALKGKDKISEIPYMIDILEPGKISTSQYNTGADILLETGNVMVQKSQGGGGSPILRGFEANKILLVVDGVRMNNAIYRSGHLQNAITIDPQVLERVEILYGPSGILYGSEALGGVIHYYTRDPLMDSVFVRASARFSTANRATVANVGLNLGRARVANYSAITISDFGDIRAGRNREDDYGDWGLVRHYVRQAGGADSTVSNPDTRIQKRTGYSQYDVLSKTLFTVSPDLDLILNLQLSTSSDIDRFDQLNDYSGTNLKYAEWHYGPQTRILASAQGSYGKENPLFNTLTTTLAFQKIDEDRITRKFGSAERLYQEEDLNVYSLNLDLLRMLSRGRLYYGVEYMYNKVGSSAMYENTLDGARQDAMSRYPGGGSNTHSISAYGNYRLEMSEHAILNTGLRYQYGILHSQFDDDNLPITDIEINSGALTGSFSFVYNPDNTWRYNLILSTGFRNPNVDDYGKVRAKDDYITIPNEDLGPECTYNAEIRTRKAIPGIAILSGSIFFTYLTNAIVRTESMLDGVDTLLYDGDYYHIVTNSNANLATINGVSLNVDSDLDGSVSFRGSLNFLKGRDITNDTPLGHIPPLYGRVSIDYTRGRFKGEGIFVYSGRKSIADMSPFGEDNEAEGLEGVGYPDWHIFNLRSSYCISEQFEVQVAVENIFDRFYKSYASGVAAPGRNFVFTFRALI